MSTLCSCCGLPLTEADRTEHKRRRIMAKRYPIILVDETKCLSCINQAVQNQGVAIVAAGVKTSEALWENYQPESRG